MGDPPGIAAVYPQTLPPGIVTADVIRIRPNRNLIVPAYLAAALNHSAAAKQVRSITAGLTRPKLTLRDYRQVTIRVPPLAEQREIGSMIKAVDDAIAVGEVVVEHLDRVRATLAEDLLRHGVPGRHAQYATTPLGRLPAGWRAVRLEEVLVEIDAGWSPACDPAPAGDGEWGVLKVSCGTPFSPRRTCVSR
jgi:type I restriction enzyme S subunit